MIQPNLVLKGLVASQEQRVGGVSAVGRVPGKCGHRFVQVYAEWTVRSICSRKTPRSTFPVRPVGKLDPK